MKQGGGTRVARNFIYVGGCWFPNKPHKLGRTGSIPVPRTSREEAEFDLRRRS